MITYADRMIHYGDPEQEVVKDINKRYILICSTSSAFTTRIYTVGLDIAERGVDADEIH